MVIKNIRHFNQLALNVMLHSQKAQRLVPTLKAPGEQHG